jgi:hypothetical protein
MSKNPIVKICDYKIATGNPKRIVCPRCRGHEFIVVTIKEKRKVSIVKLACAS